MYIYMPFQLLSWLEIVNVIRLLLKLLSLHDNCL